MLYFRLNRLLPDERQALAAMGQVIGFNPLIAHRRVPADDGSYRSRYAVMVPAGRRPDSVLNQMSAQVPSSQWTLVDVDSDGYETPVAPERRP